MISPHILLALLFILASFAGIFSALEAGYISLNKIRLRHLRQKKVKGAERVYKLVSHMDELITTVLVCNNLANTAIAAIASVVFVEMFGAGWGVFVSTVVVTILLLIFCETTPKIFATNHAEFVAFNFRHLTSATIFVFRPVVKISTAISAMLLRCLGVRPKKRVPIVTEEEIKMMIHIGKDEGYYSDDERRMIERIFHFDEIDVFEVMTPFDKMVMIDANFDEDQLADLLMEEGHNRIPVYEKDRQNIIGILYVHDLLYLMRNNKLIRIQDLLSQPYYVQPDKKVSRLLKEFQAKKIQIALVRAVTGKILGLVTLEDLIEEIVGEIEEFTPI